MFLRFFVSCFYFFSGWPAGCPSAFGRLFRLSCRGGYVFVPGKAAGFDVCYAGYVCLDVFCGENTGVRSIEKVVFLPKKFFLREREQK